MADPPTVTTLKAGRLYKSAGSFLVKPFDQRWFILTGESLTYFESEKKAHKDAKERGTIPLSIILRVIPTENKKAEKKNVGAFDVVTEARTYTIFGENRDITAQWQLAIEGASSRIKKRRMTKNEVMESKKELALESAAVEAREGTAPPSIPNSLDTTKQTARDGSSVLGSSPDESVKRGTIDTIEDPQNTSAFSSITNQYGPGMMSFVDQLGFLDREMAAEEARDKQRKATVPPAELADLATQAAAMQLVEDSKANGAATRTSTSQNIDPHDVVVEPIDLSILDEPVSALPAIPEAEANAAESATPTVAPTQSAAAPTPASGAHASTDTRVQIDERENPAPTTSVDPAILVGAVAAVAVVGGVAVVAATLSNGGKDTVPPAEPATTEKNTALAETASAAPSNSTEAQVASSAKQVDDPATQLKVESDASALPTSDNQRAQTATPPGSPSTAPNSSQKGTVATPPTSSKMTCHTCGKDIIGNALVADDKTYHTACFVCSACHAPINGGFVEVDGKILCQKDFESLHAPRCHTCTKPILEAATVAKGNKYHPECFTCGNCRNVIDTAFIEHEGVLFDQACHDELFALKCASCSKVLKGQFVEALDRQWHFECLTCAHCSIPLATPGESSNLFPHEGVPYCAEHYLAFFADKCAACGFGVQQGLDAMGKTWHSECFVCNHCSSAILGGRFAQHEGMPYCSSCTAAGNLFELVRTEDDIDFDDDDFDMEARPFSLEEYPDDIPELTGQTLASPPRDESKPRATSVVLQQSSADTAIPDQQGMNVLPTPPPDPIGDTPTVTTTTTTVSAAATPPVVNGPNVLPAMSPEVAEGNRLSVVDPQLREPRERSSVMMSKRSSQADARRASIQEGLPIGVTRQPTLTNKKRETMKLAAIKATNVNLGTKDDLGVLIGNALMFLAQETGRTWRPAKIEHRNPLTKDDFRARYQYVVPFGKNAYDLEDFAPEAFVLSRNAFGVSNSDFMASIRDGVLDVYDGGSRDFRVLCTRDERFMIKCLSSAELPVFLKNLDAYTTYMVKNRKTTLLPRLFGLHKIKPFGQKAVRVVVMQNVLLTGHKIADSLTVRATKVYSEQARGDLTNVDEALLRLGDRRFPLLSQLLSDVGLLKDLKISNYALAIGVCKVPVSAPTETLGFRGLASIWQAEDGGVRGHDTQAGALPDVFVLGLTDVMHDFVGKKGTGLDFAAYASRFVSLLERITR